MITIDLYQPGKVDCSVDFPSKWNELTLQELHMIASMILSDLENPWEHKGAVFLQLLHSRANNKVSNIVNMLDAENCCMEGLPAIEFLYNENNLTKQPFPKLKISQSWIGKKMNGPEDAFDSITCGEFEACEYYYEEFKNNSDPAHLANIAAILYRPHGTRYTTFDHRTGRYSVYEHEQNVKHFGKLSPTTLFIIFLWYAGCREELPKIFKHCFEGGDTEATGSNNIFTKTIHNGAGVKNGSRDNIRCTLLKEFFFQCEIEAAQAAAEKEAYEKANK